MKLQAHPYRSIAVCMAAGLLLAACRAGAEEGTPTIPVEQIQTEAVATFSSGLTATALALPTETPTETAAPTPTPTFPTAITVTPSPAALATSPTDTCYGMTFVSDVTIPDNTSVTPGQQFTKTWRVRNSGTCEWLTGFRLNFTGGEAMGGSSVELTSAVQPGDTADISVNLTAPTTAGSYRGNWRMTNAAGTFFGDEIFVLIVVSGTAATSTPSASATPTLAPPTATATDSS